MKAKQNLHWIWIAMEKTVYEIGPSYTDEEHSKGHLDIKMPSYQYRNYLYNGSPHTWKDGLYIETGPWNIPDSL